MEQDRTLSCVRHTVLAAAPRSMKRGGSMMFQDDEPKTAYEYYIIFHHKHQSSASWGTAENLIKKVSMRFLSPFLTTTSFLSSHIRSTSIMTSSGIAVVSPTTSTTLASLSSSSPPSQTKARTALDELGTRGEFKRREAAWRNWIKAGTYVRSYCSSSPKKSFGFYSLLGACSHFLSINNIFLETLK